jgi:energy-coupling factor transporter transmembrane protein EcfT
MAIEKAGVCATLALLAALVVTMACFFAFSRMGIIACLIGLALTLQFTRDAKVINWKLVAPSILALVITVVLTCSYLNNARNTLPYLGNTDKTEVQGHSHLASFFV